MRAAIRSVVVLSFVGVVAMPVAASAAPPPPWHEQNSKTSAPLKGIEFTDKCHGWAVGEAGAAGTKAPIVATRNGGRTWTKQNSGRTDTTLNRVDFVDNTHGWAVGEPFETGGSSSAGPGTILRTTNGGSTWSQQTNNGPLIPATEIRDYEGLSFVSRQQGWIAVSTFDTSTFNNSGTILHTADGGATYTEQTVPDPSRGVADVYFVDANNGWAVQDGGDIINTTDGGLTWVSQFITGTDLEAVAFYNSTRGVAVGDQGKAWVTTDGGTNWNPAVIAAPSGSFGGTTLTDVTFPTSSRVAVSTEPVDDTHSRVLVSTNGGAVLNVQDTTTSETPNSVAYPRGANAGWISGEGGMIRSNDPNAGAGC